MFQQIFVLPIFNLLFLLFSLTKDMGLAVILLTVLIRGVVLWPLAARAIRSQKKLQDLAPELKKVKEKAGGDKQKESALLMELYKEKEINPLSSCLPLLVQLPVLFALFVAFNTLGNSDLASQLKPISEGGMLYQPLFNIAFIKNLSTTTISLSFLGLVNLAQAKNIVLAVLTAATQFFQQRLIAPQKPVDESQKIMAQMNYIFPLLLGYFSYQWPAALGLYWTVFNLIAIAQQKVIMSGDLSLLRRLRWTKTTPPASPKS